MKYTKEYYKNNKRFNCQYAQIREFLKKAAEYKKNEHYHFGRFEWMHMHSYLETDKLTTIAIFRDESKEIVGLLTYDTGFGDRTYLIHTSDDEALLNFMVDTAITDEQEELYLKVNSEDCALEQLLTSRGFYKSGMEYSLLTFDFNRSLAYEIPEKYTLSKNGFVLDPWKYQVLIHKGFENEGEPTPWEEELAGYLNKYNSDLKVFAISKGEYCAHCGLWYEEGEVAYVEPVMTVPEHRNNNLAKATIYEAFMRAKKMGAKRAIVISDQDFYKKIGFHLSSEVYNWKKTLL